MLQKKKTLKINLTEAFSKTAWPLMTNNNIYITIREQLKIIYTKTFISQFNIP